MSVSGDLTYNGYLKIPELLSLQRPQSGEHDEMHFIVVHQVYELWFRLVLHEVEAARTALLAGDAERPSHHLHRVNEILRLGVQQFDVIETMRPYDFLKFRDVLKPASGFQSVQFREIEYVAGARDERFLRLLEGDAAAERLRRRLSEPSLWEAFLTCLRQSEVRVEPHETLKRELLQIERGSHGEPLRRLSHALLEFDERVAIWRSRHIQMTERMIGGRPGTGERLFKKLSETGYSAMGTGGVDYLETTLSKRFFPLLWEVRSELSL